MPNIGKKFIKMTKFPNLEPPEQQLGKSSPSLETDYNPMGTLIDLPFPPSPKIRNQNIKELIEKRESLRDYSKKPFTLEELSYLLWCTQGVKKVWRGHITLRTVPSAGARHSFETYLLVNNVDSLESGLYRFLAIDFKLLTLSLSENISDEIAAACFDQTFIRKSAVTFIWVAVPYRMNWRYGERGYRYLFLDAGHICQNLYLAAESIGAGACAVGAFDDDKLNTVLGLDGETEMALYLAAAGRRK